MWDQAVEQDGTMDRRDSQGKHVLWYLKRIDHFMPRQHHFTCRQHWLKVTKHRIDHDLQRRREGQAG